MHRAMKLAIERLISELPWCLCAKIENYAILEKFQKLGKFGYFSVHDVNSDMEATWR
jgi:hypothetical protein